MEDPAIAAARQLAESSPEAKLACPWCANTMKGASLAEHLADAHAGATSLPLRWEGSDHASQSVALWLGIAAIAVMGLGVALAPDSVRLIMGAGIALLLPALGLGMASGLDKLPGSLELEGDALALKTLFGMRTRRLRLPPHAIEVGQLRIWVESPVGGASHQERRMGNYLRLSGDGDTLILGAPKGTQMAKRWDSTCFTNGPKRQYWHLHLDRQALVALEYHLAARGALDARRVLDEARRD